MKFATLVTLVAVTSAQEEEAAATEAPAAVEYGAACDDATPCETGECVLAADGVTGYCQDCTADARAWTDGEVFVCAADAAGAEEEGSASLVASAAAFLAAASMMA